MNIHKPRKYYREMLSFPPWQQHSTKMETWLIWVSSAQYSVINNWIPINFCHNKANAKCPKKTALFY